MNILDIQDNTLIICEENYKKYILKKLCNHKLFLNVKIITKKEFFNEYLFKYNNKTISYLVNTYNYKVAIAKMYLDNLYCVEDKDYNNQKLEFLINLKKELINKNLLVFNDKFRVSIKNYKEILVVNYPFLDKYEMEIFNELNAKIINDNENYNIDKVYEFQTMEDEITFVVKSICKLINDGIDINKIKLIGLNDEYYNDLERIFNFHNIPVKIGNGESLYSNTIVKKFLDNYDSDIKNGIEVIKNEDSEIVKKIINICNQYTFESDAKKIKPLIIEDLKNTKINNFKLKNYIEIVDVFDNFEDEYVFLMNFNVGSVPTSFKDEEYITDNIKNELNMFSVMEKNKIYKNSTKDKIKSIKNLVISYKLKSSKGEYYPSSLISELGLEVIKMDNDILESYSVLNDKIEYAKTLDEYKKYGSINDNYYIYKNSLGDISYNSYDNSFKGINKNSLREYLKGKLTLSYSSLNNFNKCSFRFYIANILKLDKYEENFEAFIGSLFHNVLEKCFINNLNVSDEVEEYIKLSGKNLSIKERFFVDKIIEDIKFAINVLNKHKEDISLDNALYEKNIVIDKSRDINVEFVGFVDKILYKENSNNTLVTIIDYKTGYIDIDLKYLSYGLSLQLPIYLYLVKKSNLFTNPKFVGFYLQYILDKEIARDIKKNYDDERSNNLKLVGYSNSDIHSLVEFDRNYVSSNIIKGMKTKANGEFSTYSKVLDDIEIDKIVELTEKNIDEAIDKILNGEFAINPKKIGYEKDVGCVYCKFRDICNRKEENYQVLEDIKTLDFLRGDENA